MLAYITGDCLSPNQNSTSKAQITEQIHRVILQQHARNSLLHDLVLGECHKSSQGKSGD